MNQVSPAVSVRMFRTFRRRRPGRQDGISMIELMIAGVVMVVGFLGLMVLITTAIATNNRNRLDSTGTMLAQAVMEQVKSTIPGAGSSTLSDCNGTTHTINTAAGGAPLTGGAVDFTQTAVTNYSMDYVVCVGTVQTTYDVRWNIAAVGGNYLVTVSSRLKGQGTSTNLKYFALPVTLRAYMAN